MIGKTEDPAVTTVQKYRHAQEWDCSSLNAKWRLIADSTKSTKLTKNTKENRTDKQPEEARGA